MLSRKEVINVPKGIRFLGQEGSGFCLSMFPDRCILDKQLPGCGFTEYCLNGQEFVILASPRIMLINNKADQHPNVFLVVNEMDKDPGVDKDLTRTNKEPTTKLISIEDQEKLDKDKEDLLVEQRSRVFNKIKNELTEYINNCLLNHQSPKILVTYDSYHIVKDVLSSPELNNIFKEFFTVVDEFQSILHDSRFKSTTEMQFLENLKSVKRVMFASATPMMEKYIDMLDEFDGLPFYTLDWTKEDQTRIIKPNLEVYLMRSVGEKAKEVIQTYLNGDFESVIVQRDGNLVNVESKEAVLYVNSVSHIITIIKKMGLTSDQVLILCSNTDENKKRIKNRLGKTFEIGHVPNPDKGEKFPMFTFCTRTVYLGADFYSDNARTFIFSDANIDSLAVDISEDLPQILGRQRLDENPWKNSATFYYRTTANYRNMTFDELKDIISKKEKTTEDLLSVYNNSANTESQKYNLARNYQKVAKSYNYKDDYVGVNIIHTNTGDKILKPKKNNLVLVNEIRAFEIQQIDYKDRFSIFAKISNRLDTNNIVNKEVILFFNNYEQLTTMKGKLKLLCECGLSRLAINIILSQIPDSDEIKSYYLSLGSKRLKELGYNVTRIKKELGIVTFSENLLIDSIYKEFKVGDKLLLTEIKDKLANIYSSINYKKTPKAKDLLEFFTVKDFMKTVIIDGVKKRAAGYELLLTIK